MGPPSNVTGEGEGGGKGEGDFPADARIKVGQTNEAHIFGNKR